MKSPIQLCRSDWGLYTLHRRAALCPSASRHAERQHCIEHKITDFLFHGFLFLREKCALKGNDPVSMKMGGRQTISP
jgi:hypothetical protein